MDEYLRKDQKIKYIDPKKLIPYEKNARTHGTELEILKNIIKKHGFPNSKAIEVTPDMVIICGHGRREAALQLGMTKVPYIIRDDLSPEAAREYRLEDNKISDLSGWDYDVLQEEKEELKELGIDLGEYGFEDFDGFDDPEPDFDDEDEGEPIQDPQKPKEKGSDECNLLVICKDEADRLNLAEELAEKGYICQIL